MKPNWIKSKKKTIDIINCEGSILKVEYDLLSYFCYNSIFTIPLLYE